MKTLKNTSIIGMLTIILIISTLNSNAQLLKPIKGGERICWAANSFTSFWGPLPLAINRVFEAADPTFTPIYYALAGKACGIIKEYYVWGDTIDGTGTLDSIRNGNWDYVIFQSWTDAIDLADVSTDYMSCATGATSYPANQDTLLKYMQLLDAEAKAVNAKTMWLMPQPYSWNWVNGFNKSIECAENLRPSLDSMFFAPIIHAWDSVRQDYPPTTYACPSVGGDGFIELLYNDCGHQNSNGTALNAFTWYTILSGGLSGEGLNPLFPFPLGNPELVDYFARVGCTIGRRILKLNGFPDDYEGPTIPQNLDFTNISTNSVTLNWSASTDNFDVTGYAVYKNGVLYDTINDTLLNITGLTTGVPGNTFTVRAYDAAGHYSSYSNTYPLSDVYYPIADTCRYGNIPVEGELDCSGSNWLAVKFDLSSVNTNINKAVFRIYKKGTSLPHDVIISKVIPDTWYEGDPTFYSYPTYVPTTLDTITGILTEGWEEADVTSYVQSVMTGTKIASLFMKFTSDSEAGWTLYYSRESTIHKPELVIEAEAPIVPVDTIPPTAPSNLVASNIAETTFTISWTASFDSIGVSEYQIYANGSIIATNQSTSMSIPWFTPGTTYEITIKARDATGNLSEASDPISVTTLTDTQVPTAPSALISTAITNVSVSLSWTASTDNVGVTEYDIYNGAFLAGTSASTTFTVTGLTAATAYTFTAKAKDDAGNESDASNSLDITTATTADTEAPTAPGGLTYTATTQTNVTLSWTASTDNVGVTAYDIYNGAILAGSSASTIYTVSGLTAATDYTFTVIAKDAAGNESATSNTLDVTTAATSDTETPTPPSGLTSTAKTQTSIDLSWTVSTDNVGVISYDIYNGAVLAGSSATTSYTASGLTAGTAYTFSVIAKDAAGNESAASNTLDVTTSIISKLDLDDNSLFKDVSIYPNPNQGNVNICLGELKNTSLNLYNNSGRLIIQAENISDKEYQLTINEAPGVYFIEVISQGSKKQFKLIKE